MPTYRNLPTVIVDYLNLLPPVNVGAHRALCPHETKDGCTDTQGVQLPDRARGGHAVLTARGIDVLVFFVLPEGAHEIEAPAVRQRRARCGLVPEVGLAPDSPAWRQRALGRLLEHVEG